MPFIIVRNDITAMEADAIVNTANPLPIYASGSDYAIYKAAGIDQLLAERQKIGEMRPGQAAETPAFALKAKYIIHTVGPVWRGGDCGEDETLAECYTNCLELAEKLGCKSIAFPFISTGVYGFPKDRAMKIVNRCVCDFLLTTDMTVYLTVFGHRSLGVASKLFPNIKEYIDSRYVNKKSEEEYFGSFDEGDQNEYGAFADAERSEREWSEFRRNYFRRLYSYQREEEYARRKSERRGASQKIEAVQDECNAMCIPESEPASPAASKPQEAMPSKPAAKKAMRSLDDIPGQLEESFQQSVLRIMAEKNFKPVEVYTRANMDKKAFSRLKTKPDYVPSKSACIALAVGLMLNLDETKDLLTKAGYALSPSKKNDLVVEYCIGQGVHEVMVIDEVLYDMGLPMLSSY